MPLDLASAREGGSQGWAMLDAATAALEPPFAVLDLDALAANAISLRARAGGLPIRVSTKSLRSRPVLDAVLEQPGFAGALAYTLPEALWLAADSTERAGIADVLVGYPTVDRAAIAALAADDALAGRVTLMVDSVEHLDLIDSVVPPGARPAIRLCVELDVSYESRVFGFVGSRRSPVRTAAQARALASAILDRPGFRLVGLMGYEGQISGTQDFPPGRPLYGAVLRRVKRRSIAELRTRRAAAVAAVRELVELEFVNGGGTGSLESTAVDPSVTEVAAGSGLFGPVLFDGYAGFRAEPAVAFVLPVVRRSDPGFATVLGGGWIASGPGGADRLPTPVHPAGLRTLPREGAGEVQTPLQGAAADALRVGDRVWFRHAKSGELSEHVTGFAVVSGGAVLRRVATYRGEGQAWL